MAIAGIRAAKLSPKIRFLVEPHERVDGDETTRSIKHKRTQIEKPRFPQQNEQHADIHRISDIPIKPAHDESLWWINWRKCASARYGEIPSTARKNVSTKDNGQERQRTPETPDEAGMSVGNDQAGHQHRDGSRQ